MRALLICLLCGLATPAVALTIQDDIGAQVVFDAPPQRIISLAPNLTELAYAAGLGSRLIAVSAYSDYPPEARKLPQVGDAFRLDWEQLLALQPDMVLAWGSGLAERDRAEFEKLGLKLLVMEPRRLGDIPKSLRLLGRIANTEAAAEAAAHAFEKQRDALRKQYAARASVRAYFQIADIPLLTVNGEHIISDVLRLCGAQNVFSDAPFLVPAISDEALVSAQPEVMLGTVDSHAQEVATRNSWLALPLDAARQNHIGFINPDLIGRSTPRILLGAQQICETVDLLRH